MRNKKIFIFLPDGIGLRNFAYSKFYSIGKKEDFDIVFWNNTLFPLADLGFNEIQIKNSKSHPLTDIYKNARKLIELNLFIAKTKDSTFDSYRFPVFYDTVKIAIKDIAVKALVSVNCSENGLRKIREKIKKRERKTLYYHQSLKTLQEQQPAMVFCTNQRPMTAIAPILAAQDMEIPTATFIFSWDNLPKATMVIETNYYFVWSEYMKRELLFYYPYIKEDQIFVVGSPQFELHFDKEKVTSREIFFKQNNLDTNKKYICFSGDDITSSPDDPKYLEDAAKAIRELNKKGRNLGIIFRRCPVDFSDRFDCVINEYTDVVVKIDPLWKSMNKVWNSILPTKEDDFLLSNIAEYSEMVINLGSSMVFDFIAHGKTCGYFRYNQQKQMNKNWDVFKCYQYIHFRSMSNEKAVIWLNNPEEIAAKIEKVLIDSKETINYAQKWFEIIVQHPPELASKRIWSQIKTLTK
jgi:hypothetical protein